MYTLGYSNWTICSPQNQSVPIKFPLYQQKWNAACGLLIATHMQHFIFPAYRKKAHHGGLQKWMTPRCLLPLGIQIGPFAVHKTYSCKINFHVINKPHAAFAFSCIQRKGHPTLDPKSELQQGVHDPGVFVFNLVHLQSTKYIFAK